MIVRHQHSHKKFIHLRSSPDTGARPAMSHNASQFESIPQHGSCYGLRRTERRAVQF
ncbi:hypothetical protein BVI2075_320072 [Burkholderia vietnamiensis]|nr:hypothetical protein BVI2075_320072 [Burkholderia vietnamiensis]CAG9210942.1 hypothetical protein BVI1335_220023 [Burkholderia vietnamiensis]